METTPLYLIYPALDPRALDCVTTVLAVDTDPAGRMFAVLRETVCHPQGGGQRADTGRLGQAAVVDVRRDRETGRILHYLEGPPPAVGAPVQLSVAIEVRRLHSGLHTGGHLVAALASRVIPGFVPQGGHHFPHEARVTGACEALPDTPAALQELQAQMEQAVREAWPVRSTLVGARRGVAIGDGPVEGCGGTHLQDCGGLRDLQVLKLAHGKGELRIRYGVMGA